jgi:hypothetical protein
MRTSSHFMSPVANKAVMAEDSGVGEPYPPSSGGRYLSRGLLRRFRRLEGSRSIKTMDFCEVRGLRHYVVNLQLNLTLSFGLYSKQL